MVFIPHQVEVVKVYLEAINIVLTPDTHLHLRPDHPQHINQVIYRSQPHSVQRRDGQLVQDLVW